MSGQFSVRAGARRGSVKAEVVRRPSSVARWIWRPYLSWWMMWRSESSRENAGRAKVKAKLILLQFGQSKVSSIFPSKGSPQDWQKGSVRFGRLASHPAQRERPRWRVSSQDAHRGG